MQLCKTKTIGAVNDNRIGCWHVDAAFYNRRTQEHIEAAMIKVEHDLFELPFRHLSVANSDACFGYQLCEFLLDQGNVLDAVVNEIDLTTAFDFTQEGLSNDHIIPFADECLDRKPLRWRRRDE